MRAPNLPRSAGRRTRKTYFPGITRHSTLLGVSYEHLLRVLKGDRSSPALVDRYNKLVERERLLDSSEAEHRAKIPAGSKIILPASKQSARYAAEFATAFGAGVSVRGCSISFLVSAFAEIHTQTP